MGQIIAMPTGERRQSGPEISVIIPALNEASVIGAALRQIPLSEDIEVIVVDGGSGDATVNIAEASGARVIRTGACRAQQMNAGAAAARAEILLFLHADTRLPDDFPRLVQETLLRPGIVAGAFQLRIDSPRRGLRIIEALANFRSRWLHMPYGDQALFLRSRHFRMADGFSNLPIMEDFEFVRRLGRLGRIALAPAEVLTSARHWERLGVLRATVINQAVIVAYLLGVSPAWLARLYGGGASAFRTSPREAETTEKLASPDCVLPSAHDGQSVKPRT
jgi:rSAM/selenodomain-associated transferase 2